MQNSGRNKVVAAQDLLLKFVDSCKERRNNRIRKAIFDELYVKPMTPGGLMRKIATIYDKPEVALMIMDMLRDDGDITLNSFGKLELKKHD